MFDPLAHGATPRKKISDKFNPLEHGAKLHRTASKLEGDSWPALLGKSVLKGVSSIADLPNLVAQGLESLAVSKANRNPGGLYGGNLEGLGMENNIEVPDTDIISSRIPTSENIRTGIKNRIGIDLEPKPTTAAQRIVAHGGEFAGGLGPWGWAAKGANWLNKGKGVLKLAKTGSVIGGVSGALQEGGVDPLIADIGSTIVLPFVGGAIKESAKGTANLLSKFSPKGRKEKLNTEVGNILKEKIGEKNIPTVLQRLDRERPLNTDLTTAELAENAGLASLHRALAPNIPALAEKNVANNALMRKRLQELGNTELLPEIAGEYIRKPIARNLERALAERAQVTTPLYEKVNELTTGVVLPRTTEFLKSEGKYAKGDIKKNLKYVENLIQNNRVLKKDVASFDKSYGHFSPQVREQLQKEVLGLPLPGELTNALKDISGRIGAAKKSGNREVARVLSLARENILADMATIPEEQIARSTYAGLSKPISAIEKEPLLSKIVKKDKFGQEFIVSPEKIPDMILSGTLNNTKALVAQVGRESPTMDTIRGGIINKLLNSTELASGEHNLSYDKMNKFLKKNNAKLNLIFNPDQVKVLEDVRELLKKRNMVATLGRAAGSNTQSETTLLNSIFDTAGNKFLREAAAYTLPGGGLVYDVTKDFFKNSRTKATKELLEKALLDPETAKLLLIPIKNIKDESTLRSILTRIQAPALAYSGISNMGGEE